MNGIIMNRHSLLRATVENMIGECLFLNQPI